MEKLNFGCGKKILSDFDNVDIQTGHNIDISFDFNKFPYPLKKNKYNYILIDNVMEHLKSPKETINELWKCCKSNATIEVIVPHCNSQWAYGDLTHVNFFTERSIKDLFEECAYVYDKNDKFKVRTVILTPSIPLQILPNFILKILARYLNNIYSTIIIQAIVVK
jgi:hypothetical protein